MSGCPDDQLTSPYACAQDPSNCKIPLSLVSQVCCHPAKGSMTERIPAALIDNHPGFLRGLMSPLVIRIPVVQMTVLAGVVDTFEGAKQGIPVFDVDCL